MYPPVDLIEVGLQEDGFIGVSVKRQSGNVRFTLRKRDAEDLRDGLDEAIEQWEDGDF